MALITTADFGAVDCQGAVTQLESALTQNEHCSRQVFNPGKAFALKRGPSGGPEALVLLFANDPFADNFWYGHVMPHRGGGRAFVSLLVWSSKFLNADSVPLLFRRLHHWMMIDPHYQPCCIREANDGYAETESFADAVTALASMVRAFDPELRTGYGGSDDACELRITQIYGLAGRLEHGDAPPIPMPTSSAAPSTQDRSRRGRPRPS